MKRRWFSTAAWLAIVFLGCAAPAAQAPASPSAAAAQPQAASGPKRITIAAMMDPAQLISKFDRVLPGAADVEVLLASGLAIPDDHAVLQPLLAETVPTVENGLWTVTRDGRMETTWKLRPGLRWHDGAPFTAEDLVFTGRLGRDPELSFFRHPGFELVDDIRALDANTAVVRWREPYIAADTLFSNTFDISRITFPLPRHLLEASYLSDKQALPDLPFWSEEFVGTGPFRVREWVRGSHTILDAFEGFALGAPRVNTLELRFIPDGNTLVANVLAGAVDATVGRGMSLDQAIEVEKQWRDGKMMSGGPGAWFAIFGQFINSDPPVIANLGFRRALAHATDRQQMAEALMYGLSPHADTLMSPMARDFKEIESQLVRYEYNPRRTAELMQGLGFTAGPDGSLRDGEGKPLAVDLRTTPGDVMVKANEAVADQWRRAGLQVQTETVAQVRQRDLEYRATHPGFELSRRGTGLENLAMFHTKEMPLPENRFGGKNLARYSSSEMDALLDRYYATVPRRERVQALAQALRHISDQLPVIALFYDTEPSLVSSRLMNLTGKPVESIATWNAHLWDLK